MGVSGRAMIEALIAGERDPHVLASLARGRMKVKHAALVQALTGRSDEHHGELARMLLDSYDALTAQAGKLTSRIGELIAAIPEARGVDADGAAGPGAGQHNYRSGEEAQVQGLQKRLNPQGILGLFITAMHRGYPAEASHGPASDARDRHMADSAPRIALVISSM